MRPTDKRRSLPPWAAAPGRVGRRTALKWIVTAVGGIAWRFPLASAGAEDDLSPRPLRGESGPIRTEFGWVAGIDGRGGMRIFKGIPYAAPPVGALRWRAPQPPARWPGVLKADRFSAAAMQLPTPRDSISWERDEPTSEDCLYLNIWTAAHSTGDRLPVMVWIHGGGSRSGSGSLPSYDGEGLARKGVVVVTFNYRLGVFGFLAHPGLTRESGRRASGNYGLLDQVTALDWVRRNIAEFGGDPDRVTIFGQSAGANSGNQMMVSPLARGLFSGIIGESGGMDVVALPPLREAEAAGLRFAEAHDAHSLAELRAKPAGDLMGGPYDFKPVIDGYFLPEDVYPAFSQGVESRVPVLVGSNADETPSFPAPKTAVEFADWAKRKFGDRSSEFLEIYPARSLAQAVASFRAYTRDRTAFGVRRWASILVKTAKTKAFLYRFERRPPIPSGRKYREQGLSSPLGAWHGAEVPYVHDNLQARNFAWQDSDWKLAAAMSDYWVNFARSGNPNRPGLPFWPAYDDGRQSLMRFGTTIAAGTVPDRRALDFLGSYVDAQRAKGSEWTLLV